MVLLLNNFRVYVNMFLKVINISNLAFSLLI